MPSLLLKRIKDWAASIAAFRTGDVIAVDGPSGSAKMSKDTLLELTARSALGSIKNLPTKYKGFMALDDADGTGKMDVDTIFNNFAGKFEDNVTEAKAGKLYMHNGSLYEAKEDYIGVWDASKFRSAPLEKIYLSQKSDIDNLKDIADDIVGRVYTEGPVTLIEERLISGSGNITNYNNPGYIITDYIDVEGIKSVKVTGSANFDNATCVFYNSDYSVNKVAIRNPEEHGADGTWIVSEDVELEVPADAKYMVLAGTIDDNGVMPSYGYFVKYVNAEVEDNIKPRLAAAETSLSKVESDVSSITDKVYTQFSTTDIENKLITNVGAIVNYTDNPGYFVTDYIDVESYDKVYVDCASNWTNSACVFYNSDYSVNTVAIKDSATPPSMDWVTRLNVEVAVPAGAKYMVLAGTSNSGSTMPKARYESGIKIKGIWSGKKWCCVGDSLTERNSRTSKNYADYVSEETGITIINMGVSGTGYKRRYENNQAFYQRVADIPLDSDVVTIFGSGNDLSYVSDIGTATDSGTTTLGGCINTTIDNIYAVLPAVHLGIVSPTPWGPYNPVNHDNAMARYSELLRQICENRSIPFLDLYHCSNLRPWDSSFLPVAYSHDDGNSVHPDETGHKLIAGRFRVFVESLL